MQLSWIKETVAKDLLLVVLLCLFIILGVIYSVITPLWEAPDEKGTISSRVIAIKVRERYVRSRYRPADTR